MTTTVTVTPAAPAAPTAVTASSTPPVISLSADAAKLYADAVTEAKAEIAKIEAALKTDSGSLKTWLAANWQHVVTWGGVAFLVLKAIKYL